MSQFYFQNHMQWIKYSISEDNIYSRIDEYPSILQAEVEHYKEKGLIRQLLS